MFLPEFLQALCRTVDKASPIPPGEAKEEWPLEKRQAQPLVKKLENILPVLIKLITHPDLKVLREKFPMPQKDLVTGLYVPNYDSPFYKDYYIKPGSRSPKPIRIKKEKANVPKNNQTSTENIGDNKENNNEIKKEEIKKEENAKADNNVLYVTMLDTIGVKIVFDNCVNVTAFREAADNMDDLLMKSGMAKQLKLLIPAKSTRKTTDSDSDNFFNFNSVQFKYIDDNITIDGFSDDQCKKAVDGVHFTYPVGDLAQLIIDTFKLVQVEVSTVKPEGFNFGIQYHFQEDCGEEVGMELLIKEKCLGNDLGLPGFSFKPVVNDKENVTFYGWLLNGKCEGANLTLFTLDYEKCYNSKTLAEDAINSNPTLKLLFSTLGTDFDFVDGVYFWLDDGVSSMFILAFAIIIALLI